MAEDPFRTHSYTPRDARRILRRAVEFAEHDPDTAGVEKPLTLGDLERAGEELGLPKSSIARALSSHEDGVEEGHTEGHSAFIGAPTRIVLEREVDGEPSVTDREDLAEMLRSEFGEAGVVEQLGKTFTWKPTSDYRGRSRQLSVRLRSRDGRTRVIVEEGLTRQATGLFVGIGVGGGVGPMGAYIMLTIKLGLIGLLAPVMWIPIMLLLARTLYGALAARRERALRRTMKCVLDEASRWSTPAPARRVRVAGGAASSDAADADLAGADADAEAEVDAGAAAGRSASIK